MKIYYVKVNGSITGAQVIADDGSEHELTTNGSLCGLWVNQKQVIGTSDFDLCCSAKTARDRLRRKALFYCGDPFDLDFRWMDWINWKPITVSRKPLFD